LDDPPEAAPTQDGPAIVLPGRALECKGFVGLSRLRRRALALKEKILLRKS